MEWEEINRRLRNGTSVSVLAELAGTTYKNMYNRIRRREQIDGKQYLKPDQLKRPYKAQGGRKKAVFLEKKLHIPEKKKNVPDPGPAAHKDYPDIIFCCDSCRHKQILPDDFEACCANGHKYGGASTVCSDYHADDATQMAIEMRRRPEVEPIGEEKAPARPEVVEKVADVPEVVREFAGIPEGVVKDTLEKYKKEQADAVREMHVLEAGYKLAKAKEMKLRTVVLALERLLEGGSL